jgi:hypothetical protein
MNSIPPALVLLGGALALPLLPRIFRSLAFVLLPVAAMALLFSLEAGNTTLRFLTFDLTASGNASCNRPSAPFETCDRPSS